MRSDGRQCAAPPSVIAGTRYEWWSECGEQDLYRFAPVPDWLKYKVGRAAPPTPRPAFAPSGLRDPVLEVDPPTYFRELCGLVPDRGFVSCPVHPFLDIEPSCRVYDTAAGGWFCYGESCRKGGDIVTLAALLAGIETPVTGYRFIQTLDYLRGRFS